VFSKAVYEKSIIFTLRTSGLAHVSRNSMEFLQMPWPLKNNATLILPFFS
jgi:hypothetical protein